MTLDALLLELATIFGVAVAVVLLLRGAGVPSIVGFLVAGALVGPHGLGLVADPHQVEVIAELGVALVLFTVGMELAPTDLFRHRRAVLLGGGLQVTLTVAAGALVAVAVGAGLRTGIFWGFLAALSSTAIVLRGLADRGESGTPQGRIVLGVLVFQDLAIVPMMLVLPLLAGQGSGGAGVGPSLLRGAAVLILGGIALRTVVPRLLARVAATRNRELFLLTVLGLALAVASTTAAVGLSVALGAFLAGVVIAETDFAHQAGSEVAPFRDAFASLFFVSIGMLLEPDVLIGRPGLVLATATVIVLGKVLLATLATMLLRLPARVSLLTGLALAQVGEFSFVLLQAGEDLHLISPAGARVFLAASVLTMAATPLLLAAGPWAARASSPLRPLERLLGARDPDAEPAPEPLRDHVIVAGLGVGGQLLMTALAEARVPHVGLDLDPVAVRRMRRAGHHVRFGDVSRAEVLEKVAEARDARMLVLLLTDDAAAATAATAVRAAMPDLPVVLRAHRSERGRAELARLGVDVVWEDRAAARELATRVLGRCGAEARIAQALRPLQDDAPGSDTRTA